MFDVIRDTAIWIMSLVLDREPNTGEAFRFILLIVFTVFAAWMSFYWRDWAYRSPAIRRKLLPNDRFSGRYLQALLHDGEVRYSIVSIHFNREKRRFEIIGRAYGPAGNDLASFHSGYILFPSGKDDSIEFIWQGRKTASANSFGGYTRMIVDPSDEGYIEGTGFVIPFGAEPKVYPLRFKHLHDHHVASALGIHSPRHAGDEPAFIQKFHAMYGDAVKEGLSVAALERV